MYNHVIITANMANSSNIDFVIQVKRKELI